MDPTSRFLDSPRRHRRETFLIDAATDRSFSYEEIDELARGTAAALADEGLVRGSRLAVDLPNSADLAVLFLAALYAGVVAVPLGAGFGRRELRSILERSKPTRVLVSAAARPRLEPVAAELEIPLLGLAADGGELDPLRPHASGVLRLDDIAAEDLAAIHFTSGTTGAPRGVGHRIGDFAGNAIRFGDFVGLRSTNRVYATLPMTYMAGYYNLLLLPFTLGASVVLGRAFDARSVLSYWDAAIRHRADVLWLVPTIMAMLLKADRDERADDYCRDAVSLAISGTAPLDPRLRRGFEERYGLPVHDSYGLSETLLAVASSPSHPAAAGSVGRPLADVEVQVRDGDGAVVDGVEGAVYLATPDMMVGYLDRDGADAPSFSLDLADGRWFETGDVGVIGDDGELRITGRLKELIIRGGVNISALAVERALEQHPDVERAAVVGIPHELLGEEIAAVVVCRAGRTLETLEPELRSLAREQLEPTQQPGVFLEIDELPRTATGKVRKATLRDLLVDRLGLPDDAKRFRVDLDDAAVPDAHRVIDLTHPLREGMLSFPSPNHARPEVTVLARHETEGRETRRLVLGTHTGTHVDAPAHFVPGGPGVESLSLDVLVGPVVVADLSDARPLEEIGVDRLRRALGGRLAHPRILLRFDWSRRFSGLDFYEESPFLAFDTCEWLLEQGVRLLGMDTPSPDDPRLGFGSGNDSPNHKLLLERGVVLLEYLNGLDQLDAESFLAALPLPVAGADGAPARVVAIQPAPA